MADNNEYEIVIGLEVHAQLLTESKLFSGDSIAYGAEPNTHVSPITLAHPGSLPRMNKKAIELAVKMGLACNCEIEQQNYFARKNYFYPDLPKGYQLSQHTTPICKGGHITITLSGQEKNIRLNRIHLEEDAGKSVHDADDDFTCIDLNRAGTALIEIVTEPDLRSGEEAFAYLTEVRKRVRYLGICDGNMEEGSLRCDANISVRKKGESKLGTRVEVKNLNSIRNVKRAIENEAERLIAILEKGGKIQQQTLSFDPETGTSVAIREKEDADDYRYFPDPDLPVFNLANDFIEKIRSSLPELPAKKVARYTGELHLPVYDANVIADDIHFATYFDQLVQHTKHYKAASNWMIGPVKNWLNENSKEIGEFPVGPANLSQLIELTEKGVLSFSVASTKLFSFLVKNPGTDPEQAARSLNLVQESDLNTIEVLVDAVLEKQADKVAEYKKGKKGLLAMFVGEVIKRSKGKADPKLVNQLLLDKLSR